VRYTAILAALLPAAVAGQPVEHRTLPSPAAVYDLVGTIRVVPGSGSDITVDIERAGPDASRLSIATGRIHDRETLRVIYPGDRIVYAPIGEHTRTEMEVDDDGTWGGNWHLAGRRVWIASSGDGLDAHADLTIHLPAGGRVAVSLGAGAATMSNVNGDVVADLSAASLTADHMHGALTLDTGSGAVRISDATGDLTLDAGSGEVVLTNVTGSRLDLDAGSGAVRASRVAYRRVKADFGSGRGTISGLTVEELFLDTGSGDVDVAFAGAARHVAIDAGSGDVTLRLPPAFGADVEIDAGSGGIKSDFELARDGDESHYHGRIGAGGGALTIDSGSGTIALVRQ
jgi:lia operon protein LiaG